MQLTFILSLFALLATVAALPQRGGNGFWRGGDDGDCDDDDNHNRGGRPTVTVNGHVSSSRASSGSIDYHDTFHPSREQVGRVVGDVIRNGGGRGGGRGHRGGSFGNKGEENTRDVKGKACGFFLAFSTEFESEPGMFSATLRRALSRSTATDTTMEGSITITAIGSESAVVVEDMATTRIAIQMIVDMTVTTKLA
ncbi:hypothetical protein CYLTODRAFT_449767 [Cylindrobasidium torrendii FP15055 ss-10]|uniref:Uncharacterized protein n=1 Tax=Cylindrobasidium torrendii FP15055 ss-10 TaxID=1314674 RepID=A0A0D7BPX1_9AGAR|nr:hypothetical protein CYLTODRAFT_449767 [Cylindrobasidium torrendii FP15055 ss-10]